MSWRAGETRQCTGGSNAWLVDGVDFFSMALADLVVTVKPGECLLSLEPTVRRSATLTYMSTRCLLLSTGQVCWHVTRDLPGAHDLNYRVVVITTT